MNDNRILKWGFAWAATVAQFLFGGWSLPMQMLIAFMVLDYLTGVGAAFVGKRLDSAVGARGIAKKAGVMVVIAMAHLLDQAVGIEAPVLQTAVTWFYLGNEGLSILENLGLIGVPIPEPIRASLSRLKAEADGDVGGD